MSERLPFHFSLACIGEGNGNPLQCSCLENPRDGGAWWTAVSGAAHDWSDLAAAAESVFLSFSSPSSPSTMYSLRLLRLLAQGCVCYGNWSVQFKPRPGSVQRVLMTPPPGDVFNRTLKQFSRFLFTETLYTPKLLRINTENIYSIINCKQKC